MPQAKGANAIIGYQLETAYGADPGTPALTKMYFTPGESLRLSRELLTSNVLQSARNPSVPDRGRYNVAGSISTVLQAYFGTLLKAALGSVSTGSGPPYTHTIKIGSSLPSLVIEKGFPDLTTPQYFKYNGCKVSKFSLKVTDQGEQEVSFDILGAKETVGTSSFDATPDDLGKQAFNGFQIATLNEGGSPIAVVTGADIELDNGIDAGGGYAINVTTPGVRKSLPEGKVKVSGTLRALFEDVSLYTKAINGTESALVITYTIGTGAGSAGNEQLTITIPELIYGTNAPVISGPAGLLVELPFEAYYGDDAEASAMWMELKNTQAAL
jgi:hypothetical protein